ncbi:hypothetical protein EC988_003271 [Linderina pennispora]|nr:hypothetical protein EC988_003271 [Linderina pennispora]
MKLFTSSAILALALAASASPAYTTSAPGQCPSPKVCYLDEVNPECEPGPVCAQVQRPVVACAWECGQTPPQGCWERCRPCKTLPCEEICYCEIVCDVNGPCTAGLKKPKA